MKRRMMIHCISISSRLRVAEEKIFYFFSSSTRQVRVRHSSLYFVQVLLHLAF